MSRAPSPPSDETLVQRTLEDERTAFDDLIERHMGTVFAIACARLGDRERAEDLVQEVFLRAFLGLDRLREPSQFAAWVGRITRNLAISWQRHDSRTRRLVPLIDAEALPDLPDTHAKGARQQMETEEREKAVWQAIVKLPPNEREVVLLHFTEDLGATEIAKRLGVHQTTITRRLQRALRQMRGLIEPVLREAAPSLRVSPRVTTRTLGVIAGAAAMSAVSKTALAAKASQEVAVLAQAPAAAMEFVASLEAAWAAITLGGQAMATGKGIAALVAAAAVVGGGVYITQQSGADPTPPTSGTAPFAVTALMPDGSRTEFPIMSADQSNRLQQDPRADAMPATVVREAGFMTVLPREFDLVVRGENLSPASIYVTEQPPVTEPHPSMLPIFLREEVDEGELPPYPHELRASTDEPGAWVISFPEPLPQDFLLFADGLSSARGFGLITDDPSEVDALVAQVNATMGDSPSQAPSLAPEPITAQGDVDRTRLDMRAMAVGLETYYVDWNVYPPSALAGDPRNINRDDPLMSQMPGLAGPMLTTPVAYLTALFQDPSATTWATFAYERFPPGDPWQRAFGDYALFSPGPDRDWDFQMLAVYQGTRRIPADPADFARRALFDPTNGATSSGDIVHSQRTSFLTQSAPVVALPTQRVSVQTATGETVEPGKMDTRSYFALMSNLGQVLQAGNRLWTISPTPLITLEEPVRTADEFEFHELDLTGDHRTPAMMRSLTPHITGGNGLWEATFDHPLRGQLLLIVLPGIVQHRQDDAFWLMRVQGTPPPNPTRVAETEAQMRGQLDQLGL